MHSHDARALHHLPGRDEPVFPCRSAGPVHKRDEVVLDEAFLWTLGTLSVPRHLWRAMGRYAAWIEPAIVNEWTETTRGYDDRAPAARDARLDALRWLDPHHDTSLVRRVVKDLRSQGRALHCMWTGKRLPGEFAVDHCFPFAAWPCNDLWNLVPASRDANGRKGDRLPSAELLEEARPRLMEWWEDAYCADTTLAERFTKEASSALPAAASIAGDLTRETLFEGVMLQRATLRRDQQLAEWTPKS